MRHLFLIFLLSVFLLASCKESNTPKDTVTPESAVMPESIPEDREPTEDTAEEKPPIKTKSLTVKFPAVIHKEYSMPTQIWNDYSTEAAALVEFEYAEQKSCNGLLLLQAHTLERANSAYYTYTVRNPEKDLLKQCSYQSLELYSEPIGDDEFYREYFHKDILVCDDKRNELRYENGNLYIISPYRINQLCISMPENTQIEQCIDGRYIVFTAFDTPFFATYIYDVNKKETTHVANLILNPILSTDLSFVAYSSSSENSPFITPENGLEKMAAGFYVSRCDNQRTHYYPYPSELMPDAKLKVKNWVMPDKVSLNSIHSGNMEQDPETQQFFSQYQTVVDYYYLHESVDINIEPSDLYDGEAETKTVKQKDFNFRRYAPLLKYTKDGETHFSIVASDIYSLEDGEKLYDKFNSYYTKQGQTVYASTDLQETLVIEDDRYKVMSGNEIKSEGQYNGESPAYLIYLANTSNKKYISNFGGNIVNQHNTGYAIDQTTRTKEYNNIGKAWVDLSVISPLIRRDIWNTFKLTTPKGFTKDGKSFEASTIFFDGNWQLLEVKSNDEQAVYGFTLSEGKVQLIAKNAFDPIISQCGGYLSYKSSPDADGIYLREIATGNTAYYSGYEDISVVCWIDTYMMTYNVEQQTHLLKEDPDVTETSFGEIEIDIPAYTPIDTVKPSEFNFGKYMPFVRFSVQGYTNNGASSIQSFAFLGKNVETLDQGRALYEKFDALFKEEYPEIDLEFCSSYFSENPFIHKIVTDMLFKSRVTHVSEDGRTVGNLSLLYSETNNGKEITDLLHADWCSKYDIITNGELVSREYTVKVDYQSIYEGYGYEYHRPKEVVYEREVSDEKHDYYEVDGYVIYESSDDTNIFYSIYSSSDLKLKYKLSMPSNIKLNGSERRAYYYVSSIRGDGLVLFEVHFYSEDSNIRYCSLLADAVNGSFTMPESYTYQSSLSPDCKYLIYTSPVYDFDAYTGENGLFYMADGYYLKNLEDGKTVFYSAEPYFWQDIMGWVEEESICEQIGGYTISELQKTAESYRDYDIAFLESNDDAPTYDFTDTEADEETDLRKFTTVEHNGFDFGKWGIAFSENSVMTVLTNGISTVEDGESLYGSLALPKQPSVSYYTLLAYGSPDDNVFEYGDNAVYMKDDYLRGKFTNHVFSKSKKQLSYSITNSNMRLCQVNDDFIVFRKTISDSEYKLVLVDLKTNEATVYLSRYGLNCFSPDRKYLISSDYQQKGIYISSLENENTVFYKTKYTLYNTPDWIDMDKK